MTRSTPARPASASTASSASWLPCRSEISATRTSGHRLLHVAERRPLGARAEIDRGGCAAGRDGAADDGPDVPALVPGLLARLLDQRRVHLDVGVGQNVDARLKGHEPALLHSELIRG